MIRCLSFDVETYGACVRAHNGCVLPPQTVFNPRRSVLTDGCRHEHLILCASITRCDLPSLDLDGLASLRPIDTMCFPLWEAHHVETLAENLAEAQVLLGHNILYDLLYSRYFRAPLRRALDGRHILIDGTHLNFLQDETRPEKSLKDIGPVLSLYTYEDVPTLRDFRFDTPTTPHKGKTLFDYCNMDSWNSALAVAEFARLTADQFPGTDKLSPFCIRYFSNLIYSVLRFTEAGVPVSRRKLSALEKTSLARTRQLTSALSPYLLLEGKGSPESRLKAILGAFAECDDLGLSTKVLSVPTIMASEMVETTKTGRLSAGVANRRLALALLPPTSPTHKLLNLWQERDDANNILSRYTYPLLRRRRTKHKSPYSVKLLPQPPSRYLRNPDSWLAHPLWYLTPSNFKDSSGGTGGQKQARPSSRDPCPNQWPPAMKACLQSRYPRGFLAFYDLSQIEMRVPTLCSGEPVLMDAYAPPPGQKPRDLHRDAAITLLGESIVDHPDFGCGDMSRDPRQWGKKGNFERLYRAGAEACQIAHLKESGTILPLELWEKFVRVTRDEWPVLWAWQSEHIATARREGIIILPITGHSRYFEGGTKWDGNEICNFPVQAPAAITLCDIFNTCLPDLPSLNDPDPPFVSIMNWYDAVVFDVRSDEDLPLLHSIYSSAVTACATTGYWSMLSDHHGRTVPLLFEAKAPCPVCHTNYSTIDNGRRTPCKSCRKE